MASAGPSIRRRTHPAHPSSWHPLEEGRKPALHTDPRLESGRLIPPHSPNMSTTSQQASAPMSQKPGALCVFDVSGSGPLPQSLGQQGEQVAPPLGPCCFSARCPRLVSLGKCSGPLHLSIHGSQVLSLSLRTDLLHTEHHFIPVCLPFSRSLGCRWFATPLLVLFHPRLRVLGACRGLSLSPGPLPWLASMRPVLDMGAHPQQGSPRWGFLGWLRGPVWLSKSC